MPFKVQLSAQLQTNKLPHAILLHGPIGSGKSELAQWLIATLACHQPLQNGAEFAPCGHCKACLLIKSYTYPDHLKLMPHGASLGVDDIRHANSFIEKTAQLGGYKTVLIPEAEAMTMAAANALLKTLEEPTKNSVLVLLASDIEMLLPTIVSRCHVLSIRSVVGKALFEKLNGNGHGVVDILPSDQDFYNLSHLAELSDHETYQTYIEFRNLYIAFLHNQASEHSLLQLALDTPHSVRWLEKITCNLLRQAQLPKNDKQSDGEEINLPIDVFNDLYKVIIKHTKVIKSYTQANEQFVIEQLLMALNDIVKSSTRR